MVKSLNRQGRKEEANQLILYVATCLYNILIRKQELERTRKQEHYQTNPFTPEWVRARYYAKRTKATHKQSVKRRSQGEPIYNQAKGLEVMHKISTKVAQKQSICMVKEWDCPDLNSSERI